MREKYNEELKAFLLDNGFKFRTHDYHNGKCSVEIRSSLVRVRDDRKLFSIVKYNKDGYFYSKSLDVEEIKAHMIEWRLL